MRRIFRWPVVSHQRAIMPKEFPLSLLHHEYGLFYFSRLSNWCLRKCCFAVPREWVDSVCWGRNRLAGVLVQHQETEWHHVDTGRWNSENMSFGIHKDVKHSWTCKLDYEYVFILIQRQYSYPYGYLGKSYIKSTWRTSHNHGFVLCLIWDKSYISIVSNCFLRFYLKIYMWNSASRITFYQCRNLS